MNKKSINTKSLKTLSMATKNVKKNFSFYGLYLFSISLIISIFFAFTSFSMNTVMLGKISADGRIGSMCRTISICFMVFVIFYMSYSNQFFLRRRIKELGIYSLLGYRKSTILFLLTLEHILICFGAFFVGLVLGSIFHKGIVIGITKLLKLSVDQTQIPLFNINAVTKTAIFIIIVIFILVISNGRFLFKTSLMDLIRYEKKADKNMKFFPVLAFFGFLMTLAGYVLALDILRGSESVWISFGFYTTGMLTMLLVILGTVFFISSFLPYVLHKRKRKKLFFYTETRIITIPNFIYRIRSNAKTLIMITLLSAVTLTVSSIMALSVYYPIAAVERMAPSDIEFRINNESQVNNIKKIVRQNVTKDNAISCIQSDIYTVKSYTNYLPAEYSLGTAKGDADNENILREKGFECISYSNYVALLEAQGKHKVIVALPELSDNECILVKYQPNSDGSSEIGSTYPLSIGSRKVSFTVKETTLHNPISFANSMATLVIRDEDFSVIKSNAQIVKRVMSMNGKEMEDNEYLYLKISQILNNSPYLQGYSHRINTLFSMNTSTFLLIGFLVVLFFIATGSIVYFNNISTISDSKEDYDILVKIGYSHNHIKKIIRKQVLLFFCIPFMFGLLDCIFATIVYKTGLMQNMLGNNFLLYVPTIIAIGLTAIVYSIYYLLTVLSCFRIIFNE